MRQSSFTDLSPLPVIQRSSKKNVFNSAVKRWSQDSNASLFDSKVHTLGHRGKNQMYLGLREDGLVTKQGQGVEHFPQISTVLSHFASGFSQGRGDVNVSLPETFAELLKCFLLG